MQQQRRSSAALFAAAAFGGDWGAGSGRAVARLHRRPLSRAHAGAARAGAELSRGAGTLLPAVRSGHWCLSDPPRQPGSGGAAAVECLTTHAQHRSRPASIGGTGPQGVYDGRGPITRQEAAAQAGGGRAQRVRPLSRASSSVFARPQQASSAFASSTAPTTTLGDPEVHAVRTRFLHHRLPTVRASVRHLLFPTRPPIVCCCSSSGAAVQRYSQQRHLGGIGAPAAAEQPLAIAGALCRARTRVRRARKLS